MAAVLSSWDFTLFYRKLIHPVIATFGRFGMIALMFAVALAVYAHMKYRFPIRPSRAALLRLKRIRIKMKVIDFVRWKIVDSYYAQKVRYEFRQFGLTLYCGLQGSGKTMSMVHYLNTMHERYPKALIVTNFRYKYATHRLNGWRDLMDIRNGIDGVIFAIDEIHSEYSSAAWKDFPEDLLSEISQQRKQRVKIVATSQIYFRVVKQLREQTHTVVQCSTVAGRWTFNKEYDAKDYELFCDSLSRDKRLKPIRKLSFVQGDFIRRCYDTYEKIERLSKMEFIPRNQRGA